MRRTKKHRIFSKRLNSNLSKTLKLSSKNRIRYVKDNRKSAKIGFTSRYQFGIKINTISEFNRIQKKLMKLALEDNKCSKKSKNDFECKVEKDSNWYTFGQCKEKKQCSWTVLYPDKFVKPGYFNINHAIMERLLINPKIFRKDVVLSVINMLGDEYNN